MLSKSHITSTNYINCFKIVNMLQDNTTIVPTLYVDRVLPLGFPLPQQL